MACQVCPKDYLPSLLKWVDPANLPTYLGGTSEATLIDDAGPWNDPQIRADIEEDIAYRDGTAGSHMSPLRESPTANSSAASSPHKGAARQSEFSGGYTPLAPQPHQQQPQQQQQSSSAGLRQDAVPTRFGQGIGTSGLAGNQSAVGVPTTVTATSPFAAHSHQASFGHDIQVSCLQR